MVDLIDKDDRFAAGSSESVCRRGHYFAHLRHVTFHSAQSNEFGVGHLGDDICQSCFAASGWTGNNQRRETVGFDCATQEFSRRQDMFLPDKLIERSEERRVGKESKGEKGREVYKK